MNCLLTDKDRGEIVQGTFDAHEMGTQKRVRTYICFNIGSDWVRPVGGMGTCDDLGRVASMLSAGCDLRIGSILILLAACGHGHVTFVLTLKNLRHAPYHTPRGFQHISSRGNLRIGRTAGRCAVS